MCFKDEQQLTAPTKNAGIRQSICKSGRQLVNFRFANGQETFSFVSKLFGRKWFQTRTSGSCKTLAETLTHDTTDSATTKRQKKTENVTLQYDTKTKIINL